MSQRPNAEIERMTAAGVIRHCMDCDGWLPRIYNFYARSDGHGNIRWSSRCKVCQCAHDSERKAAIYARRHPRMDANRGRPRKHGLGEVDPRVAMVFEVVEPFALSCWRGVATDLEPSAHLAWMWVCR